MRSPYLTVDHKADSGLWERLVRELVRLWAVGEPSSTVIAWFLNGYYHRLRQAVEEGARRLRVSVAAVVLDYAGTIHLPPSFGPQRARALLLVMSMLRGVTDLAPPAHRRTGRL